MSRLPIRLRLTLAVVGAMLFVLTAAGFLLYARLAASLDRTTNQGLRARAADVAALIQQADTGLGESRKSALFTSSGGFARVIATRGAIVDQTPGLGRAALLSSSQLERARTSPFLVKRAHFGDENVRLFAVPVAAQDRHLIVVVGTSLETRDDALAELRNELFIGGPLALLLASAIAYLVAAAALRPVERMRAQAESISGRSLSKRLAVARSHDELSRLGVTLNEMLTRVESSLERERSFLADASHELRTPLTLLKAEIELALERPRPKRELEAALQGAREESDRLAQLADDLLLLARLDQNVLRIQEAPAQLDDVLSGIVSRFERRAQDNGRTITADGHGLKLTLDRLRVEQALTNLVDNALRYGSGPLRLTAIERDEAIEIHVTDEGPGFPPEFLPHSFERFSRAGESRGRTGTGLGLAIVATVARAHGGEASAANRPEGGADVWLSFPLSLKLDPMPISGQETTSTG
jgi:two-component system OmpR family sensor kinase